MRKVLDWYGLEGRLALIGWLGYMGWMVLFCVLHQMVMAESHIDFVSSIQWTLREWGFWMLITPTLVSLLSKSERSDRPWLKKLALLTFAFGIALAYKVAVNVYSGALSFIETLTIYAPKYVQLLLVISLGWFVLRKGEQVYHASNKQASQTNTAALPKKMLVNHGGEDVLIDKTSICAIQVAGHFVDIHTATDTYFQRATLQSIKAELPESFVECHRSAIINLDVIKTVSWLNSISGEVELECGRKIPASDTFLNACKPTQLYPA